MSDGGVYFYRTNVKPLTGPVMVIEANHPLVSGPPLDRRTCAACGHMFKVGDETVLIPLGPGQNPDEREKCRSGRPYAALCEIAHARCAGQ